MKILVGYDRSKVADSALKLALKHAKVFNADIHIMTSMLQSHELTREDIEEVESKLDNLQMSLKLDKIVCETHASVSHLSAGEDLVQFAQENSVDEIFIGIKKRSKVEKLVFGSTAQYVILNSPCPVVAVK